MSHLAIRVENLSKRYRVGLHERYRALRDTLSDALYAPRFALWRLCSTVGGRRSAKKC